MNKKKQYYISCGTGVNQVPLIQAAKDLGYAVVGIDQNINSDGMKLCHIKVEESILNPDGIYRKIQENIPSSEIGGGFSASYGKAILSWCHIAEYLNLNGISPPLAETLLDKLTLRKSLETFKEEPALFEQPKFIDFSYPLKIKQIEDQLSYPLILKPRDGHSKKNIFLIKDKKDLKNKISKSFFDKNGIRAKQIMLEEFIQGNEITVVGFVQNFTFHMIFISDKFTAPHPPFVEIEHSFPSVAHPIKQEITNIHQKIVDTLQISCSPIVSEWKYYKDKLYLVEFSPQVPGEHIADYLIPRSLKYSYYLNLVKLTTEQTIQLPKWNRLKRNKIFRVKYWLDKPNDEMLEYWRLRSDFFCLINENPKFPPDDNTNRYGVIGFVS